MQTVRFVIALLVLQLFATQLSAQCPSNPQLLDPAGSATNVPATTTLRWSDVGADDYEIYIATAGACLSQTPQATTRATSFEVSQLQPGTSYEWRVRARKGVCPGQNSLCRRFTTSAAPQCPAASITVTSPAPGTSIAAPVVLTWSPLANATGYRVWISTSGSAPAIAARTIEPRVTLPLGSGSVEWFVEGIRTDCPSVFSGRSQFNVQQSANCGSAAPPVVTAPVSSGSELTTVTETVTFRWNASPGAAAYRVWASLDGKPFADLALTTETSVVRELAEGSYVWYLEALYAGCPSVPSARAAFRVDDNRSRCSTDTPTLISPAQGAQVAAPVTLTWTAVDRAKPYRVYGSLDGGQPVLLGVTPETSLTRSLPPGRINWVVEAIFEECPSTRSTGGQFTVLTSQNCSGEKPQLISPAANATISSSPTVFSWTAVSGSPRYVVFARVAGGSATPIAETAETSVSRNRLAAGTIEWWVVALPAGCSAVESLHSTFVVPTSEACNTRRPQTLAPAPESELTSPVTFAWTAVANATGYRVRVVDARGESTTVATTTTATEVRQAIPAGRVRWYVEALLVSCPSIESAESGFTVVPAAVVCRTPGKLRANVIGQTHSDTEYRVRWTQVAGASLYEIQESTIADFAGAITQSIDGASLNFKHAVSVPARYYYRVRAVSSCNDDRGPYSEVVSINVVPEQSTGNQRHASAELGTLVKVGQKVFLAGTTPPVSFTATIDRPWLAVTPSSGTLGGDGLTLTISADPAALPAGTSTGTVTVVYSAAGKSALATTAPVIPVSVSLVTPVVASGKNTPPPDSMIIPAIAHAEGASDSLFESDIRVANLSAQTVRYQLNFTPSNVDGTTTGSSTTIDVAPGETMALDDILANFFGTGASGATGALEIRPQTTAATGSTLYSTATPSTQLASIASSRTYNVTANGTFGQYIPAIQYSNFIGKSATSTKTLLSLQQISQSAAYRTNVGLVEASGEAAEVLLTVYDNSNVRLGEIPVSLKAGEHRQLNALLATNNIALTDGRIEVEVTSSTGKVTAYASVLDNKTSDPLLVSPVLKGGSTSNRFVLPGIADIQNSAANWRSDLRVFNSGTTATTATLAFYPQGSPGTPTTKTLVVNAGEVKALDDVLRSYFGLAIPEAGLGGSVVITTPTNTSLIATARTYNLTSSGTYGQFIPGVTPAESTGIGGRSLQLLQLEQSTRFRTNIGVAETNGQEATVRISITVPGSLVTAIVDIPLAANEFRQISLASFFESGTTVYNTRASVKVLSGNGKVTAYGSVIDMQTQDPTYVPAQ